MESQILNIVKYLIKESPIGQIKNVLENLKIIIGFEMIDSTEVVNELLKYEEEHCKHFNLENEKLLISSYLRDDEGYYFDQIKGYKFRVLPLLENINKLEKTSSSNDEFQNILQEEFLSYKTKNFKNDITAVSGKFLS